MHDGNGGGGGCSGENIKLSPCGVHYDVYQRRIHLCPHRMHMRRSVRASLGPLIERNGISTQCTFCTHTHTHAAISTLSRRLPNKMTGDYTARGPVFDRPHNAHYIFIDYTISIKWDAIIFRLLFRFLCQQLDVNAGYSVACTRKLEGCHQTPLQKSFRNLKTEN